MGSLSLLQRIFLTQELNQEFSALQADSLPTELSGEPSSKVAPFLKFCLLAKMFQSCPTL